MKKNKNERFIAKMITATLISVGIAGVGTGALLGNMATTQNPKDYADDAKYVAGITALSLGAVSTSLGVAGIAGINSSKEDENQNTL